MSTAGGAKDTARKAAFAARKLARSADAESAAIPHLLAVLHPLAGQTLAGYRPIRTEISPLPAMAAMAAFGPVGVPVIAGQGLPLAFHKWTPDTAMVEGPFGARVPANGRPVLPQVLIVPLLAFDARGYRLGYGGGFYDRTLEKLRAAGPVQAIGFAFSGQQIAQVPTEPTDQRLDLIVTEQGPLVPRG